MLLSEGSAMTHQDEFEPTIYEAEELVRTIEREFFADDRLSIGAESVEERALVRHVITAAIALAVLRCSQNFERMVNDIVRNRLDSILEKY